MSLKKIWHNIFMQPILTADSFRLNSGQFQVQLVCAGFSDAVKTADESVSVRHEAA